ncbi:PREDICTED: uncharacterized protein LOC106810377 isoform X2 [Priapulus caudatus]|uniref:RING-type E3 ubiquitin transferase n=1 Tax=Priapulus caudatus TaxID=37621 RepID=A0ABM1EAG4_PRICU|nr:PREDICTED: uncharacterized protein LOC106810377 isoform X2 [Priapulus caudatus]
MQSTRMGTGHAAQGSEHCRYYLRGSCRKGLSCNYSHMPADVPICKFFRKGTCFHGDHCWFRHEGETLPIRANQHVTSNSQENNQKGCDGIVEVGPCGILEKNADIESGAKGKLLCDALKENQEPTGVQGKRNNCPQKKAPLACTGLTSNIIKCGMEPQIDVHKMSELMTSLNLKPKSCEEFQDPFNQPKDDLPDKFIALEAVLDKWETCKEEIGFDPDAVNSFSSSTSDTDSEDDEDNEEEEVASELDRHSDEDDDDDAEEEGEETEEEDDEEEEEDHEIKNNRAQFLALTSFFDQIKDYNITGWPAANVIELVIGLNIMETCDESITTIVLHNILNQWKPSSLLWAEFLVGLTEDIGDDSESLAYAITMWLGAYEDGEVHLYFGGLLAGLIQLDGNQQRALAECEAVLTVLPDVLPFVNLELSVEGAIVGMLRVMAHKEVAEFLRQCWLKESKDMSDWMDCFCDTEDCQCINVDWDEAVVSFRVIWDMIEQYDVWDEQKRVEFFQEATAGLWSRDILMVVAEMLFFDDKLKVLDGCKYRETDAEGCAHGSDAEQRANTKMTPKKCLGEHRGKPCHNTSKRYCRNKMCGKCCDASGCTCDVHMNFGDSGEDMDYPSMFMQQFYEVKPCISLFGDDDVERFVNTVGSSAPPKRVMFHREFSVKDEHLSAVFTRCPDLQVLELGDSDSGCGSCITDDVIIELVAACPKLRNIRLSSCVKLTDKSFKRIIETCVDLRALEISGNDKISGRLSAEVLRPLFCPQVAPKLHYLCFADQNVDIGMKGRLCRSRKQMIIDCEETIGDSMAARLVAGFMGDYSDTDFLFDFNLSY